MILSKIKNISYLQDIQSSHLSQLYDARMQQQQAIKVLCKLDPIIFWCNANDIFFLHIILVHSLAHHFLRILFWSMVKQIIVCAYFSFALQIRFFVHIFNCISFPRLYIQLYIFNCISSSRCQGMMHESVHRERTHRSNFTRAGLRNVDIPFWPIEQIVIIILVFCYYLLGQGCEMFTCFLDQLKFWHLMHW